MSNDRNSPAAGQAICLDLRELCGRRHRLKHEADRKPRVDDDPWLLLVDCQHGTIGPWGKDLLVASTKARSPLACKLAKLPGARIAQDGDDGANIIFPADQFKAACRIMHPRRRRRVTDQERARLAEMGRTSLEHLRNGNVEVDRTARRRVPRGSEGISTLPGAPVRSEGREVTLAR